jgi:hypothetical protein
LTKRTKGVQAGVGLLTFDDSHFLLFQILGDGGELFQGGFQIGGDFLGDDFGGGQVGGFFQGVVFQPEDVEVHFVALHQFVVGEAFEALAVFAVVAVFGIVARDEVVEIGAFEGVFFESEMQVGAQVESRF